jgi:hypothetical protein
MNQVHNLPSYFLNISYNITFHLLLGLPSRLFSFRLSYQNAVCISHVPCLFLRIIWILYIFITGKYLIIKEWFLFSCEVVGRNVENYENNLSGLPVTSLWFRSCVSWKQDCSFTAAIAYSFWSDKPHRSEFLRSSAYWASILFLESILW